jgi:hypothetical protein
LTRPGRVLTVLAVLAFAGYLLWSTLSSQQVECSVTVAFAGAEGRGSASAASEEDARREAQVAACGPLTGSMDERIACSRIPPATRECRQL